MAPPVGLEPTTSWLTVTRSTDWAKEEYVELVQFQAPFFVGFYRDCSRVIRSTSSTDWAKEEYLVHHQGFEPGTHWLRVSCSTNWANGANKRKSRHRLIFPGRLQPSIFSTHELNYRVRNGNGWILVVIDTDYSFFVKVLRTLKTEQHSYSKCLSKLKNSFQVFTIRFCVFRTIFG